MPVFKFYDAVCETCGNWYGSQYKPPQVNNQPDAIAEMTKNGWAFEKDNSFCETCKKRGNERGEAITGNSEPTPE